MNENRLDEYTDDQLGVVLKTLEGLKFTHVGLGCINYHVVEQNIIDITAELERRNEPYLWKCECGRTVGGASDICNSGGTFFGLTPTQISKLRLKWQRDGNRIEDI